MSRRAVEIVAPTEVHIDALAANLRPEDRAEAAAGGIADIRAAIAEGVYTSGNCHAALIDGNLAAIFGVRPLSMLSDTGIVWLLGTPVATRYARPLLRVGRSYIPAMLQTYPRLVNFVHAENAPAVRWLRSAGFTLHPAIPHGPHGAPFHPFEIGSA